MTEDSAVKAAREMASPVRNPLETGKTGDVPDYTAAALEMTYQRGDQWLGGTGSPVVANSRCVWVVTVDGPFEPRSTPEGETPKKFDIYTVMFDATSSEFLGVSAGTYAGNLITGDRT